MFLQQWIIIASIIVHCCGKISSNVKHWLCHKGEVLCDLISRFYLLTSHLLRYPQDEMGWQNCILNAQPQEWYDVKQDLINISRFDKQLLKLFSHIICYKIKILKLLTKYSFINIAFIFDMLEDRNKKYICVHWSEIIKILLVCNEIWNNYDIYLSLQQKIIKWCNL